MRLREEKVTVERRPVDRPATDADFAAAGKEVIEMTETAEEPVVSKRTRVVEEVVVQKDDRTHRDGTRTERHTDVDVRSGAGDRDGDQARVTAQDFATYTPMFQKHYATAFAGTGAAYASMSPRTAMATS